MAFAVLPDRTLLSIDGEDAEKFLQTVITPDLTLLGAGEARPGALLSPQGKILFDFLISREGPQTLLVECRADVSDDLAKRLSLYRLRAKAQIAQRTESVVTVFWDIESGTSRPDSSAGTTLVRDRRFPDGTPVWRSYDDTPAAEGSDPAGWNAFRIGAGVAEAGLDFPPADAFPHDVLLDQNGGVGFRKGCYVGQEVVSRMQHRATARRRVMVARSQGRFPAPGTEIVADGRSIGVAGSSVGTDGIAIVRIDKVRAALDGGTPITADGALLTLSIPAWAHYTLPADAAESA